MNDITVLTASFDDIRELDPKLAEWCEKHGCEGDAVDILAKSLIDRIDCSDMVCDCIETVKYMLDYED